MDPLTILQVIGHGLAISAGLYEIANGIGSSAREVRAFADEVDSFSRLLGCVKAELDRVEVDVTIDLRSLVNDVVSICGRVLQPLLKLQDNLKPLLAKFRDSPGKLRQVGLRLRWAFTTRSRLLFYRDALHGQHRILDTALALLTLQTAKDRSPENT
jgi:hypothetical protein